MSPEQGPPAPDIAAIDKEIKKGVKEQTERRFLNNFSQNLPGGFMRVQLEEWGMLERRLVDTPSLTKDGEDQHSALAYQKTWIEFFADIDQAVVEAGLDLDKLAVLQEYWPREKAAQEAMNKYVLPVYRLLRIAGYSHYDLWR